MGRLQSIAKYGARVRFSLAHLPEQISIMRRLAVLRMRSLFSMPRVSVHLHAKYDSVKVKQMRAHLKRGDLAAFQAEVRKLPVRAEKYTSRIQTAGSAGLLDFALSLLLESGREHTSRKTLKIAINLVQEFRSTSSEALSQIHPLAIALAHYRFAGDEARKIYREFLACSGMPKNTSSFRAVMLANERAESML